MVRMLCAMFFSCFALLLSAQNQTVPNQHVRSAFSEGQIASMSAEKIDYLNFISENAWEVIDIPEGKLGATESLPLLFRMDQTTKQKLSTAFSCADIGSFNLLNYDYSIKKEPNYYRIENCNKWLLIKGHDEITASFNEYKN